MSTLDQSKPTEQVKPAAPEVVITEVVTTEVVTTEVVKEEPPKGNLNLMFVSIFVTLLMQLK